MPPMPALPPPLVTVMGVTGSGKTTVGAALAQRLQVPFADADDFHPAANVEKMSAGIALDDDDRLPWLRTVGAWLADHATTGAVIGCSALKRWYRDLLREAAPGLFFVHLAGTPEVIARRVAGRPGHFMPASLVKSQFATLEPLGPDERGLTLDLDLPVDELVARAHAAITSVEPQPVGKDARP
jgi:gluconokinase